MGAAIRATDGDDDTLAYALSGAGSSLFAISGTGQITVATGAVLDHEDTASYTLTLRATDDATLPLSDTTTVNITVNDVNETPSFASSSHTRNVNENTAAGTRLAIQSPPRTLMMATPSRIHCRAGRRQFQRELIRPDNVSSGLGAGAASYTLTLTARDSGGLQATTSVRITVRDVNDPPEFSRPATPVKSMRTHRAAPP